MPEVRGAPSTEVRLADARRAPESAPEAAAAPHAVPAPSPEAPSFEPDAQRGAAPPLDRAGPGAQIEARRALDRAAAVPWRVRGVALLAAAGHGLTWIARALALPISAAAERRRAARRALAQDER
ncbi:hypothetical protein WMF31_26760 [Sorangium sp. So ce1036]|uniref:hypothetical protein n=1 Tax=Sorangium sp. So ce1036 TaxID=3133328 RepID=UPI003EFE999B